jgi:clan AA aspartic protease
VITGVVNDEGDAVVRLTVRGPAGKRRVVEVIVDTGYDGFVTLPRSVIDKLGLRWRRQGSATLADGSTVGFSVFDASVTWNKRVCPILVDEAETAPLLGMSLLWDHHLSMDVRTKGRVEITPLD